MQSHSRGDSTLHVSQHHRWYALNRFVATLADPVVANWIAWPGSLTERLASHLEQPVQVQVLSERREQLFRDERELLGVGERCGRVREIRLLVAGTAYVVARTVYPGATGLGRNSGLRRLGNRSLGSMLFGRSRAPVIARQATRLHPDSAQWRQLRDALPDTSTVLYARRAVHLLRGQPLLVTEIFLPALWGTKSGRNRL